MTALDGYRHSLQLGEKQQGGSSTTNRAGDAMRAMALQPPCCLGKRLSCLNPPCPPGLLPAGSQPDQVPPGRRSAPAPHSTSRTAPCGACSDVQHAAAAGSLSAARGWHFIVHSAWPWPAVVACPTGSLQALLARGHCLAAASPADMPPVCPAGWRTAILVMRMLRPACRRTIVQGQQAALQPSYKQRRRCPRAAAPRCMRRMLPQCLCAHIRLQTYRVKLSPTLLEFPGRRMLCVLHRRCGIHATPHGGRAALSLLFLPKVLRKLFTHFFGTYSSHLTAHKPRATLGSA